ncbi:MAG TPA: S41 family peptidase [Terracidiphilus sp.]|jgi:C-terminal processing protease CtpA/Prc
MLAMKRCTPFIFMCAFALPLLSQNAPQNADHKSQSPQPGASPRFAIQQSLPFTPQAGGTNPAGWFINPDGTVHVDNAVVHGGRWSVQFHRELASKNGFSVITRSIPIDFAGGEIELHGYLRTQDVTGYAGLWMREDGEGQMLKLENMSSQHVDGTRDWIEYTIRLPIDENARELHFGVLLSGAGTMWADDLRLLVDDKPIAEANPQQRVLTVLDTDHEFDKGSKLQLSSLTPTQIDNLITLGRVWGFLKYHHPAVAAGKRQWDYDLFRILPAILAAPDGAHANDVLVHWIDSLGEVTTCQAEQCAPVPKSDLNQKPDIDWIRDTTTLGSELSIRLQRIYQNRPRTNQFYVSLAPGIGNPHFDHELSYSAVALPDSGFQLLALFRWWNIMQYWAPYRLDAGQNWPAVLAEFIPKLVLANDRTAYQLAMFELVAKANDTHANLWSSLDARPPVGKCSLPVDLRFIDGQAVVTGLAGKDAASGLQMGDILDAIDGTQVAKLTEEWTPYYADSNVAARRRDMARTLTQGDCKPVDIQLHRNGKLIDLHADRLPRDNAFKPEWHDLPGDTFQLLSPDVAYLKLSSIKAADVPKYIEEAAKTKGLVVDIRNYPSEFMPFVLGAYFVSTKTSFATFTAADLANPGAFSFGDAVAIDPGSTHYSGKVVILVDETSLSQAEYTTMAFRCAPNAIVVGSTTAGADGNVSAIPLPGGLSTMVSGIGVFYPNHAPTQRIGIVPDIEAKPTLAGIKAGRDEVLETAIRQILGPQTPQATIEKIAGRPLPRF